MTTMTMYQALRNLAEGFEHRATVRKVRHQMWTFGLRPHLGRDRKWVVILIRESPQPLPTPSVSQPAPDAAPQAGVPTMNLLES